MALPVNPPYLTAGARLFRMSSGQSIWQSGRPSPHGPGITAKMAGSIFVETAPFTLKQLLKQRPTGSSKMSTKVLAISRNKHWRLIEYAKSYRIEALLDGPHTTWRHNQGVYMVGPHWVEVQRIPRLLRYGRKTDATAHNELVRDVAVNAFRRRIAESARLEREATMDHRARMNKFVEKYSTNFLQAENIPCIGTAIVHKWKERT